MSEPLLFELGWADGGPPLPPPGVKARALAEIVPPALLRDTPLVIPSLS